MTDIEYAFYKMPNISLLMITFELTTSLTCFVVNTIELNENYVNSARHLLPSGAFFGLYIYAIIQMRIVRKSKLLALLMNLIGCIIFMTTVVLVVLQADLLSGMRTHIFTFVGGIGCTRTFILLQDILLILISETQSTNSCVCERNVYQVCLLHQSNLYHQCCHFHIYIMTLKSNKTEWNSFIRI